MKIAILDDYQDAVRELDSFALLDSHDVKVFNHSARGLGQMAARLAPFDALVLIRERTQLNRALLARLPNLKLISQTGMASGHSDVAAATALGIAIAEGVGSPTAPAELTWALIMAAQRKIVPYATHLKAGTWQTVSTSQPFNTLGTTLKGRTLAIWGYGRIGKLVAGYGKAFGMDVLVWGSDGSRAAAQADGHGVAASREAFFEAADVLTLHLRLADATRGIVTGQDLARMKPGALFVNTSRAVLPISTWMRFSHRWNCCAIPSCAACRWWWAAARGTSRYCSQTARAALPNCAITPAAALSPHQPMKRGHWACFPRWAR
jgi:D-3-phosphoglycerate dehydrogenase